MARRGRRRGWLLLILGSAIGCDGAPPAEVIQRQNEQRRLDLEAQKKDPPRLTPKEKQRRAERLEMEYGDLPPP